MLTVEDGARSLPAEHLADRPDEGERERDEHGYFVLSLDTEMAWGYFDCFRPAMFSHDGSVERRAIERLLDIFEEFDIAATWAVVGHMFYARCEECSVCPVMAWKGKYPVFEAIHGASEPLWYGEDVIDNLLSRDGRHEVVFHGYTHRVFDESSMSMEEARLEIAEWLRVAGRKGLGPSAAIFPRNRVGHLEAFEEAGFVCYRGPQPMHPTYSIPFLGKALNRVDLVLQFLPPQVYRVDTSTDGILNIPSSAWLFRIDRGVEGLLDAINLHRLRLRGISGAVVRAAQERKVFHLWAHPHEFRNEKDFDKLRYILGKVQECAGRGELESVGMTDLALRLRGQSGRKAATHAL